MEKTKNNKGLVVVIITLMVIILGLIFYICYDKGLILNNKKSTQIKAISKNKEEEVDINSALVKQLSRTFKIDGIVITIDGLNNNNLTKLRIAYDNIFESRKTDISCKNMTSDTDESYCGQMTEEMSNNYTNGTNSAAFKKSEENNYTTGVSQEDMEDELKWLFGSDFKIKHESFGLGFDINPSCYYAKYDANKKVYAQYYCEGGGSGPAVSQEVTSATKKGNILKINADIITDENNSYSITYEFKKDKINENYVFVKVEEEK